MTDRQTYIEAWDWLCEVWTRVEVSAPANGLYYRVLRRINEKTK